MKHVFYSLVLVLFFCTVTYGQLKVASVFTDHMIVQRNKPISFYGTGTIGDVVTVSFLNVIKKVTVANDATWIVSFKKEKASAIAKTVIITSTTRKIIINDILIGDLWLCIGQSNMEWPMQKEKHYELEKKMLNMPMLRFYNASYAGKAVYNKPYSDSILKILDTDSFYKAKWQVSDTNTIKQMSAVAYYFGKEIILSENVPIGLLNLAIGGCPIESFMDEEGLKKDIIFSNKIKGNWLYNTALPVWIRERGRQNLETITPIYKDNYGPNHPYKPGLAYKAGIVPLFKTPIKGILWYQGESNAQEAARVFEYGALLKKMIRNYRKSWKQPKLPFYWVQLSSIDSTRYKSQFWPEFRNQQRMLLDSIKYGGMAVSSDIGAKHNVHPTNKRDVGKRLAYWALHKTYKKVIVPSGPLPLEAVYKKGRIIISFNYASTGLKTLDNERVKGFSLDGKISCLASIRANTIEIITEIKPKYVYYGWKPYSDGNIINNEGLPTSTFKLDVLN